MCVFSLSRFGGLRYFHLTKTKKFGQKSVSLLVFVESMFGNDNFSSFFFVYQLFSQVFFTTGMSDDQPFDNDRTEKGLRKKEEPGVVSLYTLTGIVQILALED